MNVLKKLGLPGLVMAALVLFIAPSMAHTNEQPDWADCAICQHVFEDMELLMACEYSVSDWSEGLIFNMSLKDAGLMPRFRAMEKKDKAMSEKFRAMDRKASSEKLCGMCNQYFAFLDKGLEEERLETPTGTILIARTDDAALRKEMHAWADGVRQAVAAFDMELAAGQAGAADCCGTCGGTAAKAAECCGTCGGAMADAAAAKAADCCGTCGGTCSDCPDAATCSGSCSDSAEKPVAQIPDFMLEQMKKCYLCKAYCDQPEMLTAATMKISMTNNGFVMNTTVLEKDDLERYQDFERMFHEKICELKEESSWEDARKKICDMCRQFCDLDHEGAVMDWGVTDTGTVSVFVSSDPEMVKKLHNLGKMLLAYENMDLFSEEAPK
jgi:hypothetical protein